MVGLRLSAWSGVFVMRVRVANESAERVKSDDEKKNGDEETDCETKHREVAPYLNLLRILHLGRKISSRIFGVR